MGPLSERELRDLGDGVDVPDSLDPDANKQPAFADAGGDNSPDLNPDGSLKTDSSETDSQGIIGLVRGLLPW